MTYVSGSMPDTGDDNNIYGPCPQVTSIKKKQNRTKPRANAKMYLKINISNL